MILFLLLLGRRFVVELLLHELGHGCYSWLYRTILAST